jgi:hypothetical protein
MAESLVAWMVVIEAALLELLTVERRAATLVAVVELIPNRSEIIKEYEERN